jgi:excisionase family DNA binding protein
MTDTRITLQDAADRLGVHYMTAYRYVRTGRLPAAKVGAEWRVDPRDLAGLGGEPTPSRPGSRRSVDYGARLVPCLVAGDETGAWDVVQQALGSGATPASIYVDVFVPALERIGDGWESGELTVADEHQASAVVLRLIGRLGPQLRRRGRPRGSIVLATPPGELHGLPVAILGDLVRAEGFRVHDLGADVPADSVAQIAAGAERLVAVGFGATTAGRDRQLRAAVRTVRAAVDVPVVVGGAAVRDDTHARQLGADGFGATAADAVELFEALAPRRRRSP